MALFKGAGVALITPFHEDGSVNYEKLTEILEEQIAEGTDAIVAVGTTGEAATLTEDEHIEVVAHTVKVVNHRITHYKAIADAVSIPCILYNVPGRTGMKIEPKTMADLYHNVKNIVGVKEATGDVGSTAELMRLVDEDFLLYSGEDGIIVPLLSIGGSGVISVLSNVAPKETAEICKKWFAGDVKGAWEEQKRALPLIHSLFMEVNPIPVKAGMNLQGKAVGPLRLPLTEMEEANQQVLKEEMRRYGILS